MKTRPGARASLLWALVLYACSSGSQGASDTGDRLDGGSGAYGSGGSDSGAGAGSTGGANQGGSTSGGAIGEGTGGSGDAGASGTSRAGVCTASPPQKGAFIGVTDVTQGSYPLALGVFCGGSFVAVGEPLDPTVPISLAGPNHATIALPATREWVAGFDANGVATWAAPIISGSMNEAYFAYVSPVDSGSTFVSGIYGTSVVFDKGGKNETTLTAKSSSPSAFVCLYDKAGAFQWAKPLGKANETAILGATANHSGTAHLAVNTRDFDGASIAPGELELTLAQDDGAILAVDATGHFLEAVKFSETQNRLMFLTELADGGLLAEGAVATSLVLAKGTSKQTSPSGTFFYARFNADLSLDSVKTVSAPALVPEQTAVAGLPDGSAVFAGDQIGTSITLGQGEAHETTLPVVGTKNNGVVAHYGVDGQLLWAVDLGSDSTSDAGAVYVSALTATTDGSVWVTGIYALSSSVSNQGNLIVAEGSKHSLSVAIPSGEEASFIVRLDANGHPVWGTALASSGFLTTDAITSTTDTLVALGAFSGAATFGTHPVTATTKRDMYLARFGP